MLQETLQFDCETFAINMDILESLGRLRATFHIVLMTDNMDTLTRFTVPALGLKRYFDTIDNSFEQQTLKCERGGIRYQAHLNASRAPHADSIVIDDSLEACVLFESLGGTSTHVQTPADTREVLKNIEKERTKLKQ